MFIITVARKPICDSIANTIARYGTGGLNIDGSRLVGSKMWPSTKLYKSGSLAGSAGEKGGLLQDSSRHPGKTKGRWPTNFILQHSPECQKQGFKKIKSSNCTLSSGIGRDLSVVNLKKLRRIAGIFGHADENNIEIVTNWVCTLGCPVRALNQQSKGQLLQDNKIKPSISNDQESLGFENNAEYVAYGSDVEIARYFKQVKA